MLLERADIVIDGKQYGGHLMFTIGTERAGLRITRGHLDRHGNWHLWLLDIFFLWRGRRV